MTNKTEKASPEERQSLPEVLEDRDAMVRRNRAWMDSIAWASIRATQPIPLEQCRGGRPTDYRELDAQLRSGVPFEYAWSQFLHVFFAVRTEHFFQHESPSSLSPRWRALLAGAAEWLSLEFELPIPLWTDKPEYFLAVPWDPWEEFGLDVAGTIERTLAKSPEAFRKRNVAYESRNLITL